jgi:hypothetical protein
MTNSFPAQLLFAIAWTTQITIHIFSSSAGISIRDVKDIGSFGLDTAGLLQGRLHERQRWNVKLG